ncbi:MAG: hypothetical protein Q3985_02470 [Eubacteriales bacterium]|nr:hypothetical protein [Eubacteriales bacterium]
MNDVIQKRIEEFAQSNTDPVAFYRFLRFEQPDMIDIRKAEDFLIEDYSSKAKTIQIIQAYRVKTD